MPIKTQCIKLLNQGFYCLPLVLPLILPLALTLSLLAACQDDSQTLASDSAAVELYQFTTADKAFIKQFALTELPPPPPAPGNRYADDLRAAKFGRKLFFDIRLSANGKISCSHCHQPKKYFTDGLRKSKALGTTRRNAPSLLGAAWGHWQYWDGRKDSLWSQALAPIEHADEQGTARATLYKKIALYYANDYEAIFSPLPDEQIINTMPTFASPKGNSEAKENWELLPQESRDAINRVFSNVGKALMAYQRQLRIPPSRFDHFVDAITDGEVEKSQGIFNPNEVAGLRLFMGKANCASCHNGPLFTNFEFHNIGAPEDDINRVDMGRYEGVTALSTDQFTCVSNWSDAEPSQCEEIRFLKRTGPELVGAFKTPTLRNISATAPYMQAGQLPTLEAVIAHYNLPKPPYYDRNQHPNRPHFDILPLQLNQQEIENLIAFLHTLTSPFPANDTWWSDPATN